MKHAIGLFFLFTAAAAFAQNTVTLDTALDNCAAYLRNQLPRGARAAILKIEARSDAFAEHVTDSLSAKIVGQNYLTVVERGRALRALEAEQNYQMSGNVSDETAASVGKQLGAELIITGSITPRGDNYAMNIRVIHVETSRIQSQWSADSVRVDPALARMDTPVITAIVRFAGTALEINDQDALIQDLQRALEDNRVSMEVVPADEAPSGTDYNFLITLRVNSRASTQSADLTVALRRGSRTLKQSDRHTFSELNMEYVVRKGGDIIKKDKAFFQSLPGILANQ
ncbi:MAG: CsgG/HfaB family protein [Treponema sp.]|nr:CsgG/HfaB family protein [Treponema sp.]